MAIPAAPLPVASRAPGKCILFGEHAVVHGRPELLLAIDLYTQVTIQGSDRTSLNGEAEAAREHPYLRTALQQLWPEGERPVAVTSVSRIPAGAGLGSSAAFCSALATGLLSVRGGAERAELAQAAFSIERGAQGVGSPGDTTACVAGGLVAVNAGTGNLLWEVTDGRQHWSARRVADPGWVWLVASSGVPRSTADAVRSVTARLARPDGPALLDRFEATARAGIDAVAAEDRHAVGERMTENQELLREVGVSHPRLEQLLAAVAPAVEGAKLTGAGAGGSIVALPRLGHEVEAQRLAQRAGGIAFIARSATHGAAPVGRTSGS